MAAAEANGFDSSHLSRRYRAERNEALHRVLRKLPAEFVSALAKGLDEADVIRPGKLFAGDSGGCAVGVMLRALDPQYRGRWVMWGRSCSIVGFRRQLSTRVPHLNALEQVFDRSVSIAAQMWPTVPEEQIARAVAGWVADEARAESLLRELSAAQGSFSRIETSSSPELATARSGPSAASKLATAMPIGKSPTA